MDGRAASVPPARLSADEREKLLRHSWVVNDALWFYEVVARYGIDVANAVNAVVVRGFGRHEMRRLTQALGLSTITTLDRYREMFRLAVDLYVGDSFLYEDAIEGSTHHIRVNRCVAFEGVARAGIAKQYRCGPLERARGWFDALKLDVAVTPDIGLCQMAHHGRCSYALRVDLGDGARVGREGRGVRP
jgi:hypothetical protein